MKSWIVSLAAAVGVLVFVAQPAAANQPELAVTPAVLTIEADGELEGTDHAIQEVRHSRGRGRGRDRGRGRGRRDFYRPPSRRPGVGIYVPPPVYRYPYHYPYYAPPRGGVYFYGPRVGIGIGW